MSLTPEELAALSQSFKDAMSDISQSVNTTNVALITLIKNSKDLSDEDKKLAASVIGARQNLDKLTEAEKAEIKAKEILIEKQLLLKSATQSAIASVGSFANGLLDNNVKLTNYSDALGKAGDAAYAFGKSFGPLGMVIGGVVKGFTALAQATLKQSQNLLDAKDELNKMGGAGSYTTESIYKMAHAADLNTETLGRLIKPMQGMGTSIMALGTTAGTAQQNFAKLITVSEEQRKQFMRLGITQEQMIQGQADYIDLQALSASSLKNQLQDTKKLQEASLAYQTTLLDLSALSGQSVQALKEKQKADMMDQQLQIKNMADDVKIADLKKQGRLDEAQALQNEKDARNAMLASLADQPEYVRKGVKEAMVTGGAIQGEAAQVLARQGLLGATSELIKGSKGGKKSPEEIALETARYKDKVSEAQKGTLRSGSAAMILSPEYAKKMGFDNTSDNKNIATQLDTEHEKLTKEQQAKRKKAEEEGTDKTADAAADAQEATIKATKAMDGLIPPIGLLGAAATAAALALGGIAAGKLFGGGGGILGKLGKLGSLGEEAGGLGKSVAKLSEVAGGLGKYVGKLGGVGKIAGGVAKGAGIGLVGAALDYGGDKLKESGHETLGGTASVLGKTAGYAGTGAMIGSVIPGVGTAIGGAVGGLVGAGVGLYDNWGNLFGSKGKGGSTDKATDKKIQDPVTNATNAFDKLVSPMTTFTSELDKANLQFKSINEKLKNYNQQFSLMTDDMDSNQAVGGGGFLGMMGFGSGSGPTGGRASGGAAPARSGGGAAPASGGGAAPASGGGDASVSLDSSSKTSGSSSGGFLSKVMSMLGFSKPSSGGRGANTGKIAGGGKVGGSMSDKDTKDMIIRHEGKRNSPYKDSLGLWTVGVGHLIGDGRTLPREWNRQFSDSEINELFDKDYDKHKSLAQSNVPGFSKYDTMGQGAFVDLTFNMGGGWPQKFKNTSKSIAMGDTEGAAEGLESSKWFTQVGRRGPEITNMIRNAKVSAKDGGLSMGPESGYPATLHGNEMIVPLDPNSILADLGKKSKQQAESSVTSSSVTNLSSNDGFRELLNINQAMMEMMSTKLDNVINKLADSHDTQNKILRYSQA